MAPPNSLLAFSTLLAISTVTTASTETYEVIERDVVIVGGGASGSHAAVRLREDYNKTVVVIEKQSNLVSKI